MFFQDFNPLFTKKKNGLSKKYYDQKRILFFNTIIFMLTIKYFIENQFEFNWNKCYKL